MRTLLLITVFSLTGWKIFSQQKITFSAKDGLKVTADLYLKDTSFPFIILFHQANFSRGEYLETAPKLNKLGFNCLAVDLRSGNEVNYIPNETAQAARDKNFPSTYLDAQMDMQAAIDYVKKFYPGHKIILLGSSYSASLCLKLGNEDRSIYAVIAFSPGEYFQNELHIKDKVTGWNKPLFVASTKEEYPYIKDMLSSIPGSLITWFEPSKSNGVHGSRALWQQSEESDDCWMTLLLFMKKMKP